LIETKNIDVFYGDIQALRHVSLSVNKGEIVALIGNNGAGKSTAVKAIVGLLRKRHGEVYFDGDSITKLPAAEVIRLGMAVVSEGRRLFGPLTVLDNLNLGAYLRLMNGDAPLVRGDLQKVFELFPILMQRRLQSAGTLSGGEQQMLAIARALMARPKAILMDEPSMGLAPLVVREIFRVIKRLKESENTILLIEQNARMALKISDRAYIMELGRITMTGTVREVLETDVVRRHYLGL
jgi:branched-chain amino acid transport system ATP-binding protein